MSNTCQQKKSNTLPNWDAAISAIEIEMEKTRKRLMRLKATRNTFVMHKKDGMEWPGSIQALLDAFTKELSLVTEGAGTAREAIPA
jgi:hypothetical protein